MNPLLIIIVIIVSIIFYKGITHENFYVDSNDLINSTEKYIKNFDDKVQKYTGGNTFFTLHKNNPLLNTNVHPEGPKILPFNDEIKVDSHVINNEIDNEMNNILKNIKDDIIYKDIPKLTNIPIYETHNIAYINPQDLELIKDTFIKYINNKTKYIFSIYTITKTLLTMIKNNKGTIIKQFDIYLYIYEKKLGYTKRVICSFIIDYSTGTISIKNIEIPLSKEASINSNVMSFDKNTKNYFKINNILGLAAPYASSSNLLITEEDIELEKQRQTKIKALDKEYNCYGAIDSAKITNKIECINFGGAWDIPVTNNIECPYYLANKNYYNERGGVKYGCELPSGVSIKGFRYYDQSPGKFNPQCYNCKTDLIGQGSIGNCCDKQRDKKVYPLLKSPDYKFPGDAPDRYNSRYELSKLNLKYD